MSKQTQRTMYFYAKDQARLDLLTERFARIAKDNGDPPPNPTQVIRNIFDVAAEYFEITLDEIKEKMAANESQS
jgi:hypothetical protein